MLTFEPESYTITTNVVYDSPCLPFQRKWLCSLAILLYPSMHEVRVLRHFDRSSIKVLLIILEVGGLGRWLMRIGWAGPVHLPTLWLSH